MQSVFRAQPYTRKTTTTPGKRAFQTRKTHVKSREGCTACKKRRKKCDEIQPVCGHCRLNCLTCSYTIKIAPVDAVSETPNTLGHDLSVGLLYNQIRAVLGSDIQPRHVHSFQHFHGLTLSDLGMKTHQALLATCITSSSWTTPSMMHMILAISQLHSNKLYTAAGHAMMTPTRHWQSALQEYQREIGSVQLKGIHDVCQIDGLVTATYLLNVLAFCIDDGMDYDETQCMDLTIASTASAGSVRSLLRVLPELQMKSSWRIMLNAFVDSGTVLELNELPDAFVRLCDLDASPIQARNQLWYRMLCYITPVLRATPCTRQIAKLFAMIGDLWTDLQPRLLARDTRTLVLFVWWLALLHRLDVWWVQGRARSGCKAILAHLSKLDRPELKPFLVFPASLGTTDCSWIWTSTTDV
ncbi:hypothetical protein AMS68_005170 [Peltaster fructicola]|uniref:Zn(2)-C6 fungal-type domain-containing protein n=1 Tax=Peltaster fructicola TaxID=286661 RepID=A0A6H0XY21_9PEZI|nr:hypothetical protein AMS68_005170 [Peltaster fructicola]